MKKVQHHVSFLSAETQTDQLARYRLPLLENSVGFNWIYVVVVSKYTGIPVRCFTPGLMNEI